MTRSGPRRSTIFSVADMLASIRVIRVVVESGELWSCQCGALRACALVAGRNGGDLGLVVETSMLTTAWDSLGCVSGVCASTQSRCSRGLAPPPDSGLDTFLVSAIGLYRAMSVYAFALSMRSADEFEVGWR